MARAGAETRSDAHVERARNAADVVYGLLAEGTPRVGQRGAGVSPSHQPAPANHGAGTPQPSSLFPALRRWAFIRLFDVLGALDEGLHNRGFTWVRLCRLVGNLEPRYYDLTTDWEHPIYVRPSDG